MGFQVEFELDVMNALAERVAGPLALDNGHTMLKAPVLVRSLKLNNIGLSQYLDG